MWEVSGKPLDKHVNELFIVLLVGIIKNKPRPGAVSLAVCKQWFTEGVDWWSTWEYA